LADRAPTSEVALSRLGALASIVIVSLAAPVFRVTFSADVELMVISTPCWLTPRIQAR